MHGASSTSSSLQGSKENFPPVMTLNYRMRSKSGLTNRPIPVLPQLQPSTLYCERCHSGRLLPPQDLLGVAGCKTALPGVLEGRLHSVAQFMSVGAK